MSKEKEKYSALCRGESQVRQKKAKCFYSRGGHKHLLIAPIKTEQVHIQPDIWIYYDVMSDSEIKIIQELAKPKVSNGIFPYVQ